MQNTKVGVLLIALVVLGILLVVFGGLFMVRSTITQAVSPIQAMTGDMSTRVAQFLNPTPTILPDPVTIIREVRSLARLETIQYSVEKVITAQTGQEVLAGLFGDRLLFVAHGIVIAGVDMGKLSPDDLVVENGVLYVHLPSVEVFIATLDNDKSYVYDRDTGLLTRGDIHLETAARQAAEAEIERAAMEDGILKLAEQNAENYLYRLFLQLGFEEVVFVHPEDTSQP